MPQTPADKMRKELQLLDISRRYIRGETQAEIGRAMEISQPTVSEALKALRKRWIEEANRNVGERVAVELAKLDELERTYWRAWADSQRPKETTITSRTGKKIKDKEDDESTTARVQTEESYGTPAYLDGVMRCIERRCQLLALDGARIDVTERIREQAQAQGLDPDEAVRCAEEWLRSVAKKK